MRERILNRWQGETPEAIVRQLVFENVVVQLENLMTYPIVQRALDENRVEIHGWVYDLATATLRAYDPEANEFRPVTPP